MGKYLPFIVPVVAAFLVLIFGFIYIQAGKKTVTPVAKETLIPQVPQEVPATLPDPSPSDTFSPPPSSQPQTSTMDDIRLKALEATTLELKSRVAALEKPLASPSTKKYPLYIPLGTGGSSGDQNWLSIPTYQVTLDPGDYPGLTSVVLEVNMRLNQASGTGYARLYNSTDNYAVSSEVSTASDKYGWFTSATFTLSSGKKTYVLQLKSSTGTEISVQNARIKISF
jgi:hypothetical protein